MRGSGGRLRPERRENFNTERSEQVGGRREGWRGGGEGVPMYNTTKQQREA